MNFQNLIIFCVLLVTVTAKLPTYKPNSKANLTPQERLDNFEHLIIQFQASSNPHIAKYDMKYFKEMSPEFKNECLKAFEKKIDLIELDYNSDQNKLEANAIQSFRYTIRDAIDRLYLSIPKFANWSKTIKDELYSMRLEGVGLHFLAYYNKLVIPESDSIGEEARWTFILNKFNGGKIIEDYQMPMPVQGSKSWMSKLCFASK